MRARLLAIFNFALASSAALLLCASLSPADARAQGTRRQTGASRTAPPSSITSNTPREQTPARAEQSGVEPDISITARVTADSLRFEKVPNPRVEFTGKPRRDTVWESERENLPQQVQPGVTYRNIGITLRITSVFADIDRIVAGALDEVPPSDNARPQQTSPPAQPPVQPAAPEPQVTRRAPQTPSPAKARAHVSLDARLANLLQLTAGADAGIDDVDLTIKGVRAEVLLKVRLDNVAAIIDRTLTTVDRNPQILERLLQSVDNTVGTVGGVANTALQPGGVVDRTVGTVGQTLNNVTQPGGLLSSTVNTLGQTVQRVVDRSGNIVERTLDTAGTVVNQRTVGSVTSLTQQGSDTTNASGQTVRRVLDTTGAIIELTLDQAGRVINSRVVSQATGRP